MLRDAAMLSLRALATAGLSVALVVAHLPLRVGRDAVENTLAALLPTNVPGRLVVAHIGSLSPRQIAFSGVNFADNRGRPMVEGVSFSTVEPAAIVRALLHEAPLPPLAVHIRRLRAFEPYLITAPETPEERARRLAAPNPLLTLSSVEITVDEVVNELNAVAFRATDVRAVFGVSSRASNAWDFRLRSLDATLHPMDFSPERLHAELHASHPGGSAARPSVEGRVSLAGSALDCAVTANVSLDGRVDVRMPRCAPSSRVVDQAAGSPVGVALRLEELAVTGVLGAPLSFRGALVAQTSRVPFDGQASPTEQSLRVALDHLDLHTVRGDLPASDLHGEIRLSHRTLAGDELITVDALGLLASVMGIPVPPAEAAARVHGTLLTLEHLRAESVGLDASGTVDLAEGTPHIDAHAHLQTPTLEALPWVRGLAHGALDAEVNVHGTPDGLDGTIALRGEHLRASGAGVRAASLDGTVGWRGNHPAVALRLRARGVQRRRQFGPANVVVAVQGDPTRHAVVDLDVEGDGMLAALPRPERASAGPRGPTSVSARAMIDRRGEATDVRITQGSFSLRGQRGRAHGDVHLGARGALRGSVHLDLGDSGTADVQFAPGRNALDVRGFDLAWLNPLSPLARPLRGHASASLQIAPAAQGGTHGTLELRHFDADSLGDIDAQLSLLPTGVESTATLRVESGQGPRVAATVALLVPDALGDAEAWFRGVREGEVTVEGVRPESVRAWLPPTVTATGAVSARVGLHRGAAHRPLDVGVDVTATGLGASVGHRHPMVVSPVRVRAHAAMSVSSLANTVFPLSVRLEAGHEERQAREGHAEDSELIPDASLVGVSATLRGQWLAGLTRAAAELGGGGPVTPAALTQATRELLTDAHADVRARVGPLRQSEWPLRRGANPAHAPGLPAGATAEVLATLQGSLLSLASRVEFRTALPTLEVAGLDEPVRANATVTLAPREGGTLLGPLQMTATGAVVLSPDASPAVRRQATLHAVFDATSEELFSRGMEAVEVRRLDVDTDAFPIERLRAVRDHEITGAVRLQLRASGDRARPARMAVTLENLRAESRQDSESHGRTPPLRVELNAVVLRDRDRWDLFTCGSANPMTEAAAGCDPEQSAEEVPAGRTETLRLSAMVPFRGGFGRWQVESERGRAVVSARGFRLETLGSFLPAETVSYLGGAISANAHWTGGGVENLGGAVSLQDGRVELPTLGEPLRNVTLEASLASRRVTIASAGVDLGRGHLSATGTVDLGENGTHAAMALDASQFPAVQEGNTFGWLDGHATVAIAADAAGMRGDVTLERASVLLHEQSVRTLQSPAPPGVFFVLGRTRNPRSIEVVEDYPMDFSVAFPQPMWIRREDFSVAVRGTVGAHIDRAGTSLTGTIEEASGQSWISQQGKRFDIDRINVQFSGGSRFDPILDIQAHHEGVGIGRIDARIGGRLSQIELTLTAENFPDASMAEIASMLLFGRRDTPAATGASPDLADRGMQMLAGQFVSFLSTAIGRQMSFRLRPILEAGETSRLGTGVSVSPRLYVEASVSSNSNALGQSAASTSSVEFRSLGEYVLTSTMTLSSALSTGSSAQAQYRWSIDLFWSP